MHTYGVRWCRRRDEIEKLNQEEIKKKKNREDSTILLEFFFLVSRTRGTLNFICFTS